MPAASLSNLLTASLQIACVALAASAALALLRVTSPRLSYLAWRAVLMVCLALPWIQPARVSLAALDSSDGGTVTTSVTAVTDAQSALSAPIDWTLVVGAVLVLGVIGRLAWVAVGVYRLRRLRTAGERADAAEHAELQAQIGTRADVRYVDIIRQPVTFGWRRPVVLLPNGLRAHAAHTRHAVLAHELVHVQRGDWLSVLFEELLRAICWFHPVMWWLVSRVQLAREEVVDATAVSLTGRRRDYLRALLAFADEVPLAPAPAFARRRHLFRRILLLSTEERMSARRVVASAAVLAVVIGIGSWSAVRALPLQGGLATLIQAQPGPVEQRAVVVVNRTLLPPRTFSEAPIYPADAQAAGVSATITLRNAVDESGSVAELRLGGLRFSGNGIDLMFGGSDSLDRLEEMLSKARFRQSDSTTAVSAESLRPLLEGLIESAALAARRTRYEPPHAGQAVVFNTVVEFNRNSSPSSRDVPIAESTRAADGAVRIGGGMKTPVKVRDVKPVYPAEAQAARVQGVVIIEARIEGDGRVSAARVLRSIPELDQAAVDAVKQWEFQPTLLNGVPTPVIMTVTVQFTLQQ